MPKKIGIQGGKGSFNEEALKKYCKQNNLKDYKTEYLYSSLNVLKSLNQEKIDRGLFAIQNAEGGMVEESVEALTKYNCKIIKEFEIIVDHCLLIRKDTNKEDIEKIISHPQALSQCKKTLKEKYPDIDLICGKGDLIDQAKAAQKLSEGEIKKNTAVLASKICAQLYNLKIIDKRLQDLEENYTTFLFVKRRE